MPHAAVQANPRGHVTFAPYGPITRHDLRAGTQYDGPGLPVAKTGGSHDATGSADRESRGHPTGHA